jgi:hypothetical protein
MEIVIFSKKEIGVKQEATEWEAKMKMVEKLLPLVSRMMTCRLEQEQKSRS